MNAPLTLTEYQDAFARLLFADAGAMQGDAPSPGEEASSLTALTRQPGFAVYRNTVMKACIDALQANYPTVCRLVGEEWFRACCALYVPAHPPRHPALLYYGEDFADFLAGFLASIGAAEDLPYLPGVARLDRAWSEAHAAFDEPIVDAAALAQLSPQALAQGRLVPHAAARWHWFADMPIHTIWVRNRVTEAAQAVNASAGSQGTHDHGAAHDEPSLAGAMPGDADADAVAYADADADAAAVAAAVANAAADADANAEADAEAEADSSSDIEWRPEGTLLTRPAATVTWRAASHAACAFLDACANGQTVAQAAAAALETEPQADLAALMADLLNAGALTRFEQAHTSADAATPPDAGTAP